MIRHLVRAWRRLRITSPTYPGLSWVDSVDALPSPAAARTIYVVGAPQGSKWVSFDCPCGRGHQVLLSTQRSHQPHWTLEVTPSGRTLRPSIDRTSGGQRCHFFLTRGRVTWV